MKINHITSAHPRYDTRVFHKIFKSVKSNCKSASLYVADGLGDDDINRVIDVCEGTPTNSRVKKILSMTKYLANKRGEIIHFHDPELMPLMLFLSLKNKVIFDIHEDFLASIPSKFNSVGLRIAIKSILLLLLFFSARRLYFVLAETDYKRKYKSKLLTCIVRNYPDLDTLTSSHVLTRKTRDTIKLLYIGSLTVERGFNVMCEIILKLNERTTGKRYELHLIGDGPALHSFVPSPFITIHGRLDVVKAYKFSECCHFGLCLLQPTENYVNSIPTKILEYNAVNLPFFVSDFPFYKSICANFRGAIPVRYNDVDAVVKCIEEYVSDKTAYFNMLSNSREKSEYAWSGQEKRLLELYDFVLSNQDS